MKKEIYKKSNLMNRRWLKYKTNIENEREREEKKEIRQNNIENNNIILSIYFSMYSYAHKTLSIYT